MFGIEFTVVDRDFYVPIEGSTAGSRYLPVPPPAGWQCQDAGLWTRWTPPAHVTPAQGWKVHVSAQFARAQHVLDVVSRVCAEHGTPFKHIRTDEQFLWLHHKHGPRTQSGKFCTAYPADEHAARRLMRALDSALAGESGPYVLTDRRFGDSGVVSYRYGGFTLRYRTEPDGARTPVMTGVDGTDVADDRRPQFVLPPGIADPFGPPPEPVEPGPVTVNGYTFTAVLQFSNAGGAYRATAPDGRPVFVKEARKDNGYQWDRTTAIERLRREHDTLSRLHTAGPGICPAPLDYFRHWEHEFLVTELVPGSPLDSWISQHHALVRTGATEEAFRDYYDRCRGIVGALRGQLRRLHAAGYAFVDLSPRNILVDDRDRPRLIDFEEAQPLDEPRPVHGAEGFLPPRALRAGRGARFVDAYALGSIAEVLVNPVLGVLDRNPAAVAHVLAGLPALPADLRRAARRLRPRAEVSGMPGPDEVAKAPREWLSWLAERVATGLAAMARPGTPPYPLAPPAHATNPHCLAHGTAGVLYALHRAGYPAQPRIVRQLRDAALAEADSLAPGLFAGTAGLAWVLAELGQVDEARTLLSAGDRYPLAGRDATLGSGVAGVALAHLALLRHDGDPYHLTRAADLLACVPDGPDLVPLLGGDESTGWAAGRPGIALALYYLSRHGGGEAALRRGRAMLLADLEQSYDDGAGLLFHESRLDRRVKPYLGSGSAGFALVAGRYVAAGEAGDTLAGAYRRSLATLGSPTMTALPALLYGVAGIGLVLSDLAGLTGSDQLRADALRAGRALFRYTVPHQGGIGFLGPGNRFSADLSWGSAGVLLFLAQLLDERPDALFTLDGPGTTPQPQRRHGSPPDTERSTTCPRYSPSR